MASDEIQNDLEPSELGTKEYWHSLYGREKVNFHRHGDPGEVWFGEESEQRIIRWLTKKNVPKVSSIVDLGSGNGMMLIELRNAGFTNLTGVDYSSHAVELARSVAAAHGVEDISFQEVDLTDKTPLGGFDLALDKGTYDAVSLSPQDANAKRTSYKRNVSTMLKKNGLFIITSCNWTHHELVHQLSDEFDLVEVIPTPTFNFGGKTGNIVSAVVFKKKS